jgi:hypothetical protein
VKAKIPDRFSILTYRSQFYHKFASSGSDSGVSSSSQSPASSDGEADHGYRRSTSYGPRRGAIQSLMDGRRARSVSSHRTRAEIREKDSNITVPLQQENPFREHMDIPFTGDMALISPSRRLQQKIKQNNNTTQQKSQQDTKSHNRHKSKNTYVNSSNNTFVLHPTQSYSDEIKRRRSLSFTPYPTPYKSKPESHTTSLLSQTQAYQQHKKYQRSHSQPPNNMCYAQQNMDEKRNFRKSYSLVQNKSPFNTEMPIGQVPPPKPRRTFATEARIKNVFEQNQERKECKTSQNQDCFLQTLV